MQVYHKLYPHVQNRAIYTKYEGRKEQLESYIIAKYYMQAKNFTARKVRKQGVFSNEII